MQKETTRLIKIACMSLVLTTGVSFAGVVSGAYQNPTPALERVSAAALTVDFCDGATDKMLLQNLWEHGEPVTLFVTVKWLARNKTTVEWLKDKQDIFQIENHGFAHHQALLSLPAQHGLKKTETKEALRSEVLNARREIERTFGKPVGWYRTAGAAWDAESVKFLTTEGINLAGYTVNLDDGATATGSAVLERLRAVKNGDVILMHGNHPSAERTNAVARWLKTKSISLTRLRVAS